MEPKNKFFLFLGENFLKRVILHTKMAGKTTLALSVCFYELYALFLSNSPSPFRNDLDEKAKFKDSGSRAFSDVENKAAARFL